MHNRKASKSVTTFPFGLILCQNPPPPASIDSLTINNTNTINYTYFTNTNFIHPTTIHPHFHQTHNLKHPNQEKGISFFFLSFANNPTFKIRSYKNSIFTFTIPFSCFCRKSQQKKMVCQVTADNLSADLWAWRKYGQKPIKGSPYPRYVIPICS